MPVQYAIDVEHHFVRTILSGVVTSHEVADCASKLRNDVEFSPQLSELIIFEGMPDIQVHYLDWQSLADRDPFSNSSKRAFVARSSTALYGAIRVFQTARNDPPNIRVFETTDDALLWLALPQGFAHAEGRD